MKTKRLVVFLLFLTCSCFSATTGLWDQFEGEIQNTTSYENPFTEVSLTVTFTRPDKSRLGVTGFYDGGSTWKFRCMPDQTGEWSYKATFSDGSLGAAGRFSCVDSDIPGMIYKDETNPIWFGFKGGEHVLIRSFHCGDRFFADQDNSVTGEKWSSRMRTEFLDWAEKQGYNMLSIASHYLNRKAENRGLGWNTPDLWNHKTQRPNPEEYRRMEAVLNDLAERGFMVYPFAGFFGKKSDYPTEPEIQQLYINYTLARISSYWNTLFMVGGPEPQMKKWPYLTLSQTDRLGHAIRVADLYYHLISVHNRTGHDEYGHFTWPSYTIVQGPKTQNRQKLSRVMLRFHHPERPLYAQETLWPGNTFGHPDYSHADIRKNAVVLIMSAAAINFADMNGNSSSGFSGSLHLADKQQFRHDIIKEVWDFFETIPFYKLSPRQDLVDKGYCLAQEGNMVLVYLEQQGTVNVSLPKGSWHVQWINARQTDDRRDTGFINADQKLTTPEDGEDWLVLLKKED